MTLLLKSSPSRPTTRSGRGRSSGSSPAPISPSSSNAWRRRRQDGCPKRHEYIAEFTCQSTKSWWDTVDGLATGAAGPLVAAHPELRTVMDSWVESENIWLARAAILHQERYRERTDSELLFAYCLRRAADREFFVRKAVGWALRSYAKVAPDVVAQFLTGHGAALSGLSSWEAERG